MAVRPYQVKMEPQAHERLKKRSKQLGITIGEIISCSHIPATATPPYKFNLTV